jgi:hypothetical protein
MDGWRPQYSSPHCKSGWYDTTEAEADLGHSVENDGPAGKKDGTILHILLYVESTLVTGAVPGLHQQR